MYLVREAAGVRGIYEVLCHVKVSKKKNASHGEEVDYVK